MAKRMIDIGLVAVDGGEDLAVVAGDFIAVESTAAHQQVLILNEPGDFKQNPTICIGVFDYIDDEEGLKELERAIAKEFTRDGMDVKSVALSPTGKINTEAFY